MNMELNQSYLFFSESYERFEISDKEAVRIITEMNEIKNGILFWQLEYKKRSDIIISNMALYSNWQRNSA